MKIKMPCKLCEIDRQKLGVSGCTHHSDYGLPQVPTMVPFGVGLQMQNPTILVPQIRDMMLAAYLFRGYYQPAGPLISVPHGHGQPPPLGKSVPLSEPSPSLSPPVLQPQQPPPPPSSAGDSSDSEVIITSVTSAKEASSHQQQQHQQQQQAQQQQQQQQHQHQLPSQQQYRFNHYPPAHTSYPYGYPPQYYSAPPPAPAYSHHDICYPPYSQHKYMFRRYMPPPPAAQYYQPGSPDIYGQPPHAQNPSNQQVVTATSTASGSSYPPVQSGPPPPTLIDTYPQPPPTLVETFPAPPPHFYHGYGHAPPPPCYTHSPPSRSLNYINATYQSCPCPIQSCPKNVHTGPLTGDSKRSNISIAKESVPLPPVALALPLEPASATGPPSPARGSAGMPPPPSPAGATYQPPPPKQETPETPDLKHAEKRRKARVGKAMVRNNIAANQNTMLLMCHAPPQDTTYLDNLDNVKREVESPKEAEADAKKQQHPAVTTLPPVDAIKTAEETPPPPPLTEPDPVQHLKVEDVDAGKEAAAAAEEDLPCVKTVAENVKVKNMKRKLSPGKEEPPADGGEDAAAKKIKLEKSNGSYKDLIKKTQNVVKINNGKRKLIGERRFGRIKFRRPNKRKLSPTTGKPEDSKRPKTSRPLAASNLHNSKQNARDSKDKTFTCPSLIENNPPARRPCKRAIPAARTPNGAKPPPPVDSSKNNVDRTIECVISGGRTSKVQDAQLQPLAVAADKCRAERTSKEAPAKKAPGHAGRPPKAAARAKVEPKAAATAKRKNSRCKEAPMVVPKAPRRSLHLRWSNGWIWEGDAFDGKVFLNSDETTVVRKCYPAMRHEEGDIVEPRDCVLLKAGQRKNELPFVAKIAALWENPDDGEMMMSLLWYYRPEHTEQGRLPSDQPDEVFASRHKDSNSVACLEDKCFVLTFNEYCRYRKNLRRTEEGVEDTGPCIPSKEVYPRMHRQPPISVLTSPDLVFFCRRVYDFRQKRIVKNPS